ncbi:MAG: nickel-dependent hydrogenase large subunit [Spirochaetota bacterium]|nr:MAG: nickel-dependent hydrogenase large subunit [Spirochaetota bacterium]
MSTKITIDPLTRIEGHMKIEATVDNGAVNDAHCSGTLFRGFEIILKGRDPRDAQRITQRVCGVCPAIHCTAATLNLDSAFGIAGSVPDNGRILRNLVLGANYLQSHVLHFYHLAALDYVDVTACKNYQGKDRELNSVKDFIERGELAPFTPRYEGDYRFDEETNQVLVKHYLEAFEIRRLAQEMLTLFGGKMPHNATIVPGGITEHPTVDKIAGFLWRLNKIKDFIDNTYIPDVVAAAKTYSDYLKIGNGPGNFLSYGVFDLDGSSSDYTKRDRLFAQGAVEGLSTFKELDTESITESIHHSWYDGEDGIHPSQEDTLPNARKKEGYSWLRSPRYEGKVYEVGPLARWVVSYFAGVKEVKNLLDSAMGDLGVGPEDLNSVCGRHLARALDAKVVADNMAGWLLELVPGEPVCAEYELPQEASGMGIVDGPRGALGHWIKIKDGVIDRYQLVVPTTWNGSPRDERGQPGPMEQSIMGTEIKDAENPYEIVRIARSFDPCLACSVHTVTINGERLGKLRVV